MATEFVRTIADVSPDQLRDEINGNTTFTVTCVDIIFQDPDQITVKFNTDPSGGEISMMDTLIAAHVPESIEVSSAILPKSPIDNFKLAVHTSYKPENASKQTYAVWTGAGDDLAQTPNSLGEGELLVFCCEPGTATVTKELKLDPIHGECGSMKVI